MIRPAKFGDIPRLAELLAEMHERSCYATVAAVDLRAAKALFVQAIQRHGSGTAGAMCAYVADSGSRVEGFVIGLLDRLYHVGDQLMASDLFLYVSPNGDPRDFARLFDALDQWAAANPNVLECRLGITDAITPWQRTAQLYRRKGYRQSGAIYERRFER